MIERNQKNQQVGIMFPFPQTTIILILLFISVTLNALYKLIKLYVNSITKAQAEREAEILKELKSIKYQLEKVNTDR